jgi:hypothetical protein
LPQIDLGIWLVRALLAGARRDMAPLAEVLGSPAMFAFDLSALTLHNMRQSGRLRIIRHGLDGELVSMPES